MKWKWKSIKQFFNFYPSEKRGVLILMSTLFIVIICGNYYSKKYSNPSKVDLFEEVLLFHEYHFDTLPCILLGKDLDSTDFMNRGIDFYLVDKILQEQKRYGMYYCTDDLLDVSSLTLEKWAHVQEYFQSENETCGLLNLNTAEEKEIVKFFRINNNKAKTFIKYRKSIGGFVKFEQINQIYGFPKKRLTQSRLSRIHLTSRNLVKFDLTKATYRNLLSHGMISRKSASNLNKLRKQRRLKLDDIRKEVNDFNKPLVSYYFKE